MLTVLKAVSIALAITVAGSAAVWGLDRIMHRVQRRLTDSQFQAALGVLWLFFVALAVTLMVLLGGASG